MKNKFNQTYSAYAILPKGLIYKEGAHTKVARALFIFTHILFTLIDLSVGVPFQVSTYCFYLLRCIFLSRKRNPKENGWVNWCWPWRMQTIYNRTMRIYYDNNTSSTSVEGFFLSSKQLSITSRLFEINLIWSYR